MNVEQARLDTFQSWPANAEVDPQRIAKGGFYYTGNGLEVECFCCEGRIKEWNYGDQVMARHRQLNPECPFVRDPITSGNIPIVSRSPSLYSQVSETNQNCVQSSSCQCSNDFSNDPSLSVKHSDNLSGCSISVQSCAGTDNTNSVLESSVNISNNSRETSNSNINFAMYRSEAARLQSFRSWPVNHIVSSESLAAAGFFYLQDSDRVQCPFCYGVVYGWEEGDNPKREHMRHFPSCALHYNMETGNIPLNESAENTSNANEARAVNNAVAVEEIRPFSGPEGDISLRVTSASEQPNVDNLGIHSHRGPREPRYSTIESRLRSFENWPSGLRQTPQELAQAGFYYTGANDQVRCFHCDGGLRQWDDKDDPWIEHARWFSKCIFMRLVKGDEFIETAVAQHPPVLPATAFQGSVNNPSRVRREGRQNRVYNVSEEEINRLMNTPIVRDALNVGFDPLRIRQVVQWRMEDTGLHYSSTDALIEDVLDLSSGTSSPELAEAEREETVPQLDSSTPQVASRERQSAPLTEFRSSPSVSDSHVERSWQGRDAMTQSANHFCNENGMKRTEENEKELEEENRRLKEARLCKICMDEEVGIVFIPCGHLAACVNCAANVPECPMCRQKIKATVRTFLS